MVEDLVVLQLAVAAVVEVDAHLRQHRVDMYGCEFRLV